MTLPEEIKALADQFNAYGQVGPHLKSPRLQERSQVYAEVAELLYEALEEED